MSDFSPDQAIAMERRHIVEGERRVARQEALARELAVKGNNKNARQSVESLNIMRASLELSRGRLRDLEERYGKKP
jgi:hypothetical protein